jgi:hypothetical protein
VIRATKIDDDSDHGFWDSDATNGDWILPADVRYKIEVRSNEYTGNHGFVATEAAPQRH